MPYADPEKRLAYARAYNREYRKRMTEAEREKERERNRQYVKANPEKNAERSRKWAARNPDKIRAHNRAYYEANRERLAVANREWREANHEKWQAGQRAWAEANRERVAELQMLAKHRRRGRPLDEDYARILYADPCSYCGGPGDTLDHITPIVAGGDGSFENLTAACRSCNSQKNARPLLEFLHGRRAWNERLQLAA